MNSSQVFQAISITELQEMQQEHISVLEKTLEQEQRSIKKALEQCISAMETRLAEKLKSEKRTHKPDHDSKKGT